MGGDDKGDDSGGDKTDGEIGDLRRIVAEVCGDVTRFELVYRTIPWSRLKLFNEIESDREKARWKRAEYLVESAARMLGGKEASVDPVETYGDELADWMDPDAIAWMKKQNEEMKKRKRD